MAVDASWRRFARPSAALPLLFVALLLSAGCRGGQHAALVQSPSAGAYRGVVLMPPLEPPPFAFREDSGAPFDFEERTAGAITIFYFAQASCGDACQKALSDLADIIAKLPPDLGQPVHLALVTLDPEPDGPERLRPWLDRLSAPIAGLAADSGAVGPYMEEALGSLWVSPASGAQPGPGTAGLFLIYTPDGAAHLAYKQEQATVETWLHDLPKLLREAAWGCH